MTPGKSFILGYTDEKDGVFNGDKTNVIIFDDFTTASKFVDFKFKVKSSAMKILKTNETMHNIKYWFYVLQTINIISDSHKRFWISEYSNLIVTEPPLWYQNMVSDYLDLLFYKLDSISESQKELEKLIENAKTKLLDTIFHTSSYKSYYENPIKIGDILKYEQPGPYIVKSTEYNDDFTTPVLTPGKAFILGYTNENFGIYHANSENKIIIFDDFTTSSRIVDFDFKVKSSAMKILKISDSEKYDIEYMYYLLQTIHINNDSHKRFWISEYAPKKVKLHLIEDQRKIVNLIKNSFKLLNSIK